MLKIQDYRPQAFIDFTLPENVAAYAAALQKVRAELLGKHYPLVIDGERVDTAGKLESINPCDTSEVVGTTARATTEDAERALNGAWKAFEDWKTWDMDARARILLKASAILKRRRLEACALMSIEVGKNYAEADVEVAEAIDFLEYYARSAMKYAGFGSSETTWFEGEENGLMSLPLGVGVSISPWNFPCAIFLGMLAAPIVAGNCVIAKPAEDSGLIAGFIADIMYEAGLPAGVLQFLPGVGSEVGEYLTTHAKTRFITFTGSRAVGLHINEVAARVQPGQKWIKKVVLELGGKDGMIVDETADLDVAVLAAVQGAFGFNGQKCSAMSRLIVVDEVYDEVVNAFVERAAALKIGTGEENAHVTAVVNQESFDKIKGYLDLAPQRGQGAAGRRGSRRSERQDRVLRAPHHRRRREAGRPPGAGGNLRAGGVGDPRRRLAGRPGHRQLHRVRPDRRRVQPRPRPAGAGPPGVRGGQPVLQPQDHRGHRGRAALRRLQHERHRQQGGRPGLPGELHAAQDGD